MRVSVLPCLLVALCAYGCHKSSSHGATWAETAPTEGGTVTALAVHPMDARILLAGTAGGLFASVDRGLVWNRVGSALNLHEITRIAFSIAGPSRVFVGTRRAGLFRSTDGGANFAAWNGDLPPGDPDLEVTAIAFDPSDGERLYLAITGRGVYRSDEGGATWTRKVTGLTSIVVHDLAVDPFDPKRVFAATVRGVHRSVDRGDNWTPIMFPLHTTSLVIETANQGQMWAVGPDGVWWSPDDGRQWARRENGMRTQPYPGQGTARVVKLDASNPAEIYVSGTEGAWRLVRSQPVSSWAEINEGLGVTRNYAVGPFAVVGQGTGVVPKLLAGVAGEGVFESSTGGVTWVRGGAGIEAVALRAVAVSTNSADVFYAGTAGRVWRSDDRGGTWEDASGDLTGRARSIRDLWVDPRDERRVLAATDAGVFATKDRGETWIAATGIGAATALAVHPDQGSYGLVMAVGEGGVYRSQDGSAGFVLMASTPDLVQLTDVIVDPLEPTYVYVVRADRGVLVSRNQGSSFSPAGQGLPQDYGYVDVQCDSGDSQRLLVSSRVGGVYRSVDLGATWSPASTGLPAGAGAGRLVADPRSDASHRGRFVVAMPGAGLYVSSDGGANWRFRCATSPYEVTSLALAPSGPDRLFVGLTHGLLWGW